MKIFLEEILVLRLEFVIEFVKVLIFEPLDVDFCIAVLISYINGNVM